MSEAVAAQTLTVTIDGQAVQVLPGTTLYDAAQQAGIDLPVLCHSPHLEPVAVCRMCVVEVEGARVLQAACIRQAEDGMVVHTQSDQVKRSRSVLVELLMSDYPTPANGASNGNGSAASNTYTGKPDLLLELAQQEGIFVGISGGATLAGALAVAKKAAAGSNILCMLPDTGERYLSTPLFEDIPADMTPEEQDISQSTPNYRFDAAPPPAPKTEKEPVQPAAADAVEFLHAATHDSEFPVVMFALEWCEFCWSVRKMFAHSVAYQKNDKGGKIRAAIREQTGLKTIPQIYVGGRHIGGATELFDAAKDGQLEKLLNENRVKWNTTAIRDPYSFLPQWLHAR